MKKSLVKGNEVILKGYMRLFCASQFSSVVCKNLNWYTHALATPPAHQSSHAALNLNDYRSTKTKPTGKKFKIVRCFCK
eukprot:m.245447 g.245447  ORF g.245447 m.245447 type:complete len:79 (-) comp15365_c1_seq30:34-270(-)